PSGLPELELTIERQFIAYATCRVEWHVILRSPFELVPAQDWFGAAVLAATSQPRSTESASSSTERSRASAVGAGWTVICSSASECSAKASMYWLTSADVPTAEEGNIRRIRWPGG